MTMLLLAAAATLAAGPTPLQMSLAELVANPAAYEGREITTCGWALNRFEGMGLAVSPKTESPDSSIAVGWLPDEPQIQDWAERCVTGVVEKMCANENPTAPDGWEAICIGPGWSLRQTVLTSEMR